MIEALCLAIIGASVGVAWASLGIYLSSLSNQHNSSGSMAIKALFVVIASFFHAYVRLSAPRLFLMVLLMIIPVLIGLTSPQVQLSGLFPIQFFYPILTAIAVLLLISIVVFPEFGSMHLGLQTIEVINKAQKVQAAAGKLFVAYANQIHSEACVIQLKDLIKFKADLAQSLTDCSAIYTECSFELAFSVLAPRELKPITGKGIKGLVSKTISLVGACESVYTSMGIEQTSTIGTSILESPDFGRIRPRKNAETADEQLLKHLLKRVEEPLMQLQLSIDSAIDIISACVAIAYDVPESPMMMRVPKFRRPIRILPEEIDVHIASLSSAILKFGKQSGDALEGAANLQDLVDSDLVADMMPREEVFLISSFIMNLRHAASHTLDMLKHSRYLIQQFEQKKAQRSLHFPKVKLRKWLFSGSEEPEAFPPTNRDNFQGGDIHGLGDPSTSGTVSVKGLKKAKLTRPHVIRSKWGESRKSLGEFLDWMTESDAALYALKFTLGVMLVSWPAFVINWTHWYNFQRGVWAPLIFVLVFENAVGSTIWIFALRTIGTIVGSLWGYGAFEARGGNEFVIAVMLMLGSIPSYYIQLGTKYQKAGMVCTISMCVVALSTHLQTVEGTSQENFYKRVTTMLIGGFVATLVQLILFPVKARERLKESITSAIAQITRMESYIALGVDETKNINTSPMLFKRFEKSRKKSSAALASAETFLTFTKQEPRLKGNFENQALIYKEIIYVLRQIADRMENMLQLRQAYGSAVLEQYNTVVFSYRRNVAAAITLTLCVIHEALTTKLALPQFLPSARLAHLRMVVRVRQILMDKNASSKAVDSDERRVLRLKFLSWNASSAALEECIEYIEELVDLTKSLVGANEFRSGILNRPNYMEYADKIRKGRLVTPISNDIRDNSDKFTTSQLSAAISAAVDEIPTSLTRIQSRRIGARLERRRTAQLDQDASV
ncbi:hypothetical protein EDC01DRAFT_33918 [Geopyxis carbonaria]|nr:hypothetical protein EDC01DRAFT_33918 [Geopyxis carbonaria]